MTVVRGKPTDPCLPEGLCDLVCLVNTYDELDRPVELLRNTRRSLKRGGILGILVYDPRKVGDLRGHAVARETVIRQARAAGYELVQLEESLPKDTLYVFRVESR
jgi:hypothetical protein